MKPDARFLVFVQDIIDEQIGEVRAEVVAGRVLTSEEVLNVLDQLANDRAKMRGLKERIGATVQ